MRITIIPDDKFVSVNGEGFDGLDLSFIDPSIHAVQWYDSVGEIERRDPVTKKMIGNEDISSFDEFQAALNVWQTKKDEIASRS